MRVGPAAHTRPGEQSYDPDTNVLRTVTSGVEVVDFMPWDGTTAPPAGRIVRVVTALRGPVDIAVDVVPGHAFAKPRKVHAFSTGIAFDGTVVRTGFPIDGRRGVVTLDAGERAVITIDGEFDDPLSPTAALDLAERTADAWRRHLSPMTYDGPYAQAVRRSLLALRGLTYYGSGAVVAAPTTSLPEHIGGERNWDYRYAWVRDASLAVDAAYDAGLNEEGERFFSWLRRILESGEFPLRPLYDVDGAPVSDEETILPLAGWLRSQPVRIGNGAASHLQLDFYSDVVAVVHHEQLRRRGSAAHEVWDYLTLMADWLCDSWTQTDRGMWEIRSEPRHLIASKIGCWYALDRMAQLAVARNPLDLDSVRWRETAKSILAWVEKHGLAADGGLRQHEGPEDEVDASLLIAVWEGPWPVDHPILTNTVDRVLRRLSDGPHVYRYPTSADDGLPPGEGAFVPCSFWAVQALAHLERWEEAHERMEQLVSFAGPLGLLPEEAVPRTGAFLGNLPQAFSHLSLVQAALTLERGPR